MWRRLHQRDVFGNIFLRLWPVLLLFSWCLCCCHLNLYTTENLWPETRTKTETTNKHLWCRGKVQMINWWCVDGILYLAADGTPWLSLAYISLRLPGSSRMVKRQRETERERIKVVRSSSYECLVASSSLTMFPQQRQQREEMLLIYMF